MNGKLLTKILVVEDERIVAKNIENRLRRLGYLISGTVSSGEDAIRKAKETRPDLVLMDIVLKGKIDGVKAAGEINSRFNIPIVYITAYADEKTIERAKITEPFGYVLKPFEINDLHSAIKIALYRHKMETNRKREKKLLTETLKSMGDAVIVTDEEGTITFMNPAAESLTGCKKEYASKRNLRELFDIKNMEGKASVQKRGKKRLLQNSIPSRTFLKTGDGKETLVEVNTAVIRDERANIAGLVLSFRRITGEAVEDTDFYGSKEHEPRFTKPEKSRIGLLVATSFALVQEGIRKILESEKDIEIKSETPNPLEIITLLERNKPDVLIVDMSLPDLDLKRMLLSVREKSPSTKTLLLLHTHDERFIMGAISHGARGFLTDTSNVQQLAQAIRTANKNEIWLETKIATKILSHLLPAKNTKLKSIKTVLSDREEEIIRLVARGQTNKQISKRLFITERTVKSHLVNIFKKLGVTNRLQLTVEFFKENPS